MRKILAAVLAVVLACGIVAAALADKARSIETEEDTVFHEEHLQHHLNDSECHVTGNYIKVRSNAKSNASNPSNAALKSIVNAMLTLYDGTFLGLSDIFAS